MFVLYATSQANTVATNQSRKTISGSDVISAMSEMEFDKFVRPLENSLASEFIFDIDKQVLIQYPLTSKSNLPKIKVKFVIGTIVNVNIPVAN